MPPELALMHEAGDYSRTCELDGCDRPTEAFALRNVVGASWIAVCHPCAMTGPIVELHFFKTSVPVAEGEDVAGFSSDSHTGGQGSGQARDSAAASFKTSAQDRRHAEASEHRAAPASGVSETTGLTASADSSAAPDSRNSQADPTDDAEETDSGEGLDTAAVASSIPDPKLTPLEAACILARIYGSQSIERLADYKRNLDVAADKIHLAAEKAREGASAPSGPEHRERVAASDVPRTKAGQGQGAAS